MKYRTYFVTEENFRDEVEKSEKKVNEKVIQHQFIVDKWKLVYFRKNCPNSYLNVSWMQMSMSTGRTNT